MLSQENAEKRLLASVLSVVFISIEHVSCHWKGLCAILHWGRSAKLVEQINFGKNLIKQETFHINAYVNI